MKFSIIKWYAKYGIAFVAILVATVLLLGVLFRNQEATNAVSNGDLLVILALVTSIICMFFGFVLWQLVDISERLKKLGANAIS